MVISAALMEVIGDDGFFLSLTAICGCLVGWALVRGVVTSDAVKGLRKLLRS